MRNDPTADVGKRDFVTRVVAFGVLAGAGGQAAAQGPGTGVGLPDATRSGFLSVEEALQRRRSVRAFAPTPLTLADVAQLLWASQGRSDAQGHRTAPSAGALYPLEATLVAGRVDGLSAGVYRYLPDDHRLQPGARGDLRAAVAAATRGQAWVAQAPILLVIAADPQRIAPRYGARAERYVHIEAGHASQNVYLQAAARGLGTTIVGAFDDAALRAALELPAVQVPLAVLPVGHPR
jgi:SagB-type dehydrogenase family enzyme